MKSENDLLTAPEPEIRTYDEPAQAVERIAQLYSEQVRFLTERFKTFSEGEDPAQRVRGFYPYVEMTSRTVAQLDSRLAYGFVSNPGTYRATLTPLICSATITASSSSC